MILSRCARGVGVGWSARREKERRTVSHVKKAENEKDVYLTRKSATGEMKQRWKLSAKGATRQKARIARVVVELFRGTTRLIVEVGRGRGKGQSGSGGQGRVAVWQ